MKKVIVDYIRQKMLIVAASLNKVSKGKIRPNHITLVSLLGHIPVAIALIEGRPIVAALLLAFFASLDALDGALARVQKSTSISGMYFDAVSDRAKEIIVFSALAVYMSDIYSYSYAWLIVAALGTSILVSYTKAKGEMAISDKSRGKIDAQKLNVIFNSGLSSYEVRVILVIIGLLLTVLPHILIFLLIANLYTVGVRIINVTKVLNKPSIAEKSAKES